MISSPPAGETPLVQLRDLSKHFPGVTALDGVCLDLRAGTIHALLGENGAGKSTLIHCLSGVLRPDRGEIRLRGQVVAAANTRAARALGIATVHQEADLFPDLGVAEYIDPAVPEPLVDRHPEAEQVPAHPPRDDRVQRVFKRLLLLNPSLPIDGRKARPRHAAEAHHLALLPG